MSDIASGHVTEAAGTPQAPRTILDAWRERGADRLDPLRFRFIDALERRAAAHSGEARRVLDAKLAALLEAYAREVERNERETGTATAAARAASRNEPASSALGGIVAELHGAARHPERAQAAYPELPELDYFRQTWARVRADRQVRQSLQPAPGNAGPLNSSSLVHRSLSLMRELSPGYLKQFLSYVDALSWMEQLSGNAPASKDPPRAATAGKGARGKSR
ncbi:DUF2894 domain-containing protein [Burkholderia sp. WSM2230]|uniref:DUF2894 domain-containing protein n=1 Tax=Burkholderia sp. WSM2230 TaxID=944435 RepID=UPI00042A16FE|nr:DUF2894 domain-containing protein [Burkholderia sp. WSM2230]